MRLAPNTALADEGRARLRPDFDVRDSVPARPGRPMPGPMDADRLMAPPSPSCCAAEEPGAAPELKALVADATLVARRRACDLAEEAAALAWALATAGEPLENDR